MEFGFKVDDQIINGIGAGQATGIINAGCTVAQAVETGQGTRANNANKVIYENIVNMYPGCFLPAIRLPFGLLIADCCRVSC
jgi:HK97 family phage major capsid protein